jgi:WD40 repeat protein
MAGLVGTVTLADLTPVTGKTGAAEGGPRPIYTWAGPSGGEEGTVRSYPPSGGAATRLVAALHEYLGVWDTGSGAFLQALQGPDDYVWSLLTYQRGSDGRPRIAAGSHRSSLRIWDGDDFEVLHNTSTDPEARPLHHLAVYEEPASGRTRLVTG